MTARPALRRSRRLESWLWTGPVGHLLGGALDLGEALVRYRWRTRRASTGAGRSSR
ncbi:MAG TPA: hypothetical protein VK707_09800 [Solirubrobacteraceae bacterium]|nr:hypothetical protein [Solirubrobacteraceae bacterium]